MKKCIKCGETKPLEDYSRNAKMRDGKRSDCKPCARAYHARHYRENRERVAEYSLRTHEHRTERLRQNPHTHWESTYKQRSMRHGFEPVVERFTKAQLTDRWGDSCFHCGGEWTELDHWPLIVSKGGPHTIENCRPTCASCNHKSWRTDFTNQLEKTT